MDKMDIGMLSALELDSYINLAEMGKGMPEDRVRPNIVSPKLLSSAAQTFVFNDSRNSSWIPDDSQHVQYGVQEQASTNAYTPIIPETSPTTPSDAYYRNSEQMTSPTRQADQGIMYTSCMTSPASTHVPSPGSTQALSPYMPNTNHTEHFFDADYRQTCYPTEETSLNQNVQFIDVSEGLTPEVWSDISDLIASHGTNTDLTFSTDDNLDITPSAQCSDQQMRCNSLDIERSLSPNHLAQYRSLPNIDLSPYYSLAPLTTIKQEPLDDDNDTNFMAPEVPVYEAAYNDPEHVEGYGTPGSPTTCTITQNAVRKPYGRRRRKDGMSENQIKQEMDRPVKKHNTRNMSADDLDRYERRKQQNREAAARCRIKKRQVSNATAKREQQYRDENVKLEQEVDELRAEVTRLTGVLADHHCVRCSFQTTRDDQAKPRGIQPE